MYIQGDSNIDFFQTTFQTAVSANNSLNCTQTLHLDSQKAIDSYAFSRTEGDIWTHLDRKNWSCLTVFLNKFVGFKWTKVLPIDQ